MACSYANRFGSVGKGARPGRLGRRECHEIPRPLLCARLMTRSTHGSRNSRLVTRRGLRGREHELDTSAVRVSRIVRTLRRAARGGLLMMPDRCRLALMCGRPPIAQE